MRLSRVLYNLAIRLYGFGILIASPFKPKARKWRKGRKDWKEKIKTLPKEIEYWFHCSSLGEFEQARPIIESISEKIGTEKILLSFFSPSGYEPRKDYDKVAAVFYLPLDTKANAIFLMENIQPKRLVFCKYDLWYHLIHQAKAAGVRLYLFASIFRKDQIYFKSYGKLLKSCLWAMDSIAVQDEGSAELLSQNGISQVVIAGDPRFDRVLSLPKENGIEGIPEWLEGKLCLMLGSSWPEDERFVKKALNFLDEGKRSKIKVIVVPHEVQANHLKGILHCFGSSQSHLFSGGLDDSRDVLVVDSIGLLGRLYRYADFVWLGGGFGQGIHNSLEPAVYGCCLAFGPRYLKFKEALKMIDLELAESFRTSEGFSAWLDRYLENISEREKLKGKLRDFVQNGAGASKAIVKLLMEID